MLPLAVAQPAVTIEPESMVMRGGSAIVTLSDPVQPRLSDTVTE